MIIDVHQHYLPRIPEYPGESRQAWLYHESRIQGYRDVPALIADMDAAGIDQIVWQGEYLLHAENCVERNRVVAAALALNPTRLRAFASIQPTHPDAVEHIKHARDMGLLGVGELNPGAQGFTMRDATVLRVLSYCADEGIPVLFHVNEPVGPAYMGKVSTPLIAFYECAARFPELKILLAHWGGGLWWYEQIPAVKQVLRNVWYDTAASFFTYPDTALMAHMASLVVPDKILFGSDYPLHPTNMPEHWLAQWKTTFADACPAHVRPAWMGQNAHLLMNNTIRPVGTTPVGTARLSMATPVVVVAEQWPDMLKTLARWNIVVTEHTPWWQTIAHALSESGHGPEVHEQVLRLLQD
jgi:predicted TIM-barrel fold metal-dependent hydrolase